MVVEEVKEALPHENGDIYMEEYACFISDEDFITKFGDSDLTYASLSQNSSTTTGWKNQSEAWHEQGII